MAIFPFPRHPMKRQPAGRTGALATLRSFTSALTAPLWIPLCLLLGISLFLHVNLLHLLFKHQPLALRGLHARLSDTLLGRPKEK